MLDGGMMALQISSGRKIKPVKTVIYGTEGIGKTSIAAKFPEPVFFDLEDGTSQLDVMRVDPPAPNWQVLLNNINEIKKDPSICRTLVIDTADMAENLCVNYVVEKNGWGSIETPGFGKGYREVNEEFRKLLDSLDEVIARGINIVVTAHARIQKFEQPDELGTYDRWTLKLFDSPKSSNAALLKEWADLLLFCNYKTTIVQPDQKQGGKAKAFGGKRMMYTTHTPAWDAKNRFELPSELDMDYSNIASCIPTIPVDKKSKTDTDCHTELETALINKGIKKEDLIEYCAEKQYCKPDITVDQFPEDFVRFLLSNIEEIADEISVPFN